LCGDTLERRVERFGFGARPHSIDDDIARGAGEPANVSAVLSGTEVELEAGDMLDDVERAARRKLREIAGVVDRGTAGPARSNADEAAVDSQM
jgi:hypothetical protein